MRRCLFTILLLVVWTVQAAAGQGFITVQGEAVVSIVPDQVRVSIGVETNDALVEQAVAENARRTEAMVRAVEEFGSDVSSVGTGVYSVYSFHRDDSERYQVTNQLHVTLVNLERIGELIDTLVASGANRVQSMQFESSRSDEAKLTALQKAVEQGQQKAAVIAQAAGVELGSLHSLVEQGGSYSPVGVFQDRMMYAAGAQTPIEPQTIHVAANVLLEYAFE